jgi:hypothetical protein
MTTVNFVFRGRFAIPKYARYKGEIGGREKKDAKHKPHVERGVNAKSMKVCSVVPSLFLY